MLFSRKTAPLIIRKAGTAHRTPDSIILKIFHAGTWGLMWKLWLEICNRITAIVEIALIASRYNSLSDFSLKFLSIVNCLIAAVHIINFLFFFSINSNIPLQHLHGRFVVFCSKPSAIFVVLCFLINPGCQWHRQKNARSASRSPPGIVPPRARARSTSVTSEWISWMYTGRTTKSRQRYAGWPGRKRPPISRNTQDMWIVSAKF